MDDLFLDLDRKNQTVFTLFFIISIIGAYLLFKSHEKRKVLAKLQYELQLREKIRLESLVYIDELANIANRRFFDVMYKKEFKNSFRDKISLSIIFCDIDFFKDYNDFYGHQAGDEALKTIAQTLKNSLYRPHDLVARYGGEEFIVLLPFTTAKEAEIVALKMKNNVRDLKILHKKSLVSKYITLSYGIASLIPNDEKDFIKLLKNADAALYEAKNSGRDKISIASV
ncbi:MAG: GGDEF domain-containing protein [Campylobacteraceae bacterium]|nr:GGDEF domain-containing protein [Campylobacteraceae bacterium]